MISSASSQVSVTTSQQSLINKAKGSAGGYSRLAQAKHEAL